MKIPSQELNLQFASASYRNRGGCAIETEEMNVVRGV